MKVSTHSCKLQGCGLTGSVANSNAMLVGIFDFDIVVANGIVAVDRASSFCKRFKQSAVPLLQ